MGWYMSYISIPFPTESFLQLAAFLREHGSTKDPVVAIRNAVDYWIDNASWKKEDLMPETIISSGSRGYMWKNVFLVQGTLLRMKKKGGAFEYAKVESDFPVYKGESLSPNQFAFKVAGNTRDAWRDVWVKRPMDQDYVPANSLRKRG